MGVDFSILRDAVRAAGWYKSAFVGVRETLTQDADGALVSGSPRVFTTVVEADCQLGIPTSIFDRRAGDEQRTTDLTKQMIQRQASLDGYFPEVDALLIAFVDDVEYNMVAFVHDSQKTQTQLLLERYET